MMNIREMALLVVGFIVFVGGVTWCEDRRLARLAEQGLEQAKHGHCKVAENVWIPCGIAQQP